jgi:putative membrane protein
VKTYLLGFVISIIAFGIATFFLPGLSYGGDKDVLFRAALAFALLNTFLRPVINILIMPINFLTLGLLGGLSGLVLLWLVSVLVPGFIITDSHFQGYIYGPLSVPPYDLNAIVTAVVGALFIGLVSSALYWLIR